MITMLCVTATQLRSRRFLLAVLLSLGTFRVSADDVSFRASIAPILLTNCYGCHNQRTSEGGYDVTSYASLLKAGDSEQRPVIAGNPSTSELLRRLVMSDPDQRMPADSDPLPKQKLKLVEQWIREGARCDASDPRAPLAAILPIRRHGTAPSQYRYPIPLTALAFFEGKLLVGGYHEILYWDLDTQELVQRIPQVGERVYRIAVDAQRGRMVVASGSPGAFGEIRLFDLATWELLGVPLVTTDVISDVAIHPREDWLLAGSADGKVYLVDPRGNRETTTIHSHSDWVRAVDWNHDGSQFATASRDKTAKVFDTKQRRPITTYNDHRSDVLDVAFVRGAATKLMSTDVAGEVHLWKATDGEQVKVAEPRIKPEGRLLPSRDGVWFESEQQFVQLAWDAEQQRRQVPSDRERVPSIAIDREHQLVAVGDHRGRVEVRDLASGQQVASFLAVPVVNDAGIAPMPTPNAAD